MFANDEWQIGHYTSSIFFLLAERTFYGLAIFLFGRRAVFRKKNGGRGGMRQAMRR
jgi:hypothetical protein